MRVDESGFTYLCDFRFKWFAGCRVRLGWWLIGLGNGKRRVVVGGDGVIFDEVLWLGAERGTLRLRWFGSGGCFRQAVPRIG